ncbi:MAG: VTT domain-containing protein [Patescibacteria group bacterium]
MDFLHVDKLIESGGVLLISLIVFAESGLLIGFFLPGDTLLFTAGFFAAQGKFSIIWLIFSIVLAAIVGDNVGYSIGKRTGKRIFKKKDGVFFRHENITKAENFYEKHGGKTIILARFVPVVRTFAPMVAGVGNMSRQKFFAYNIVGALLWGAGVTLAGYFLGSKIPNIETYVFPVLIVATTFTFGPTIYHLFKDGKIRKSISDSLRRWWMRITLRG